MKGAIAVPMGNPELVRQLNGALHTLKVTGKFYQILDKWSGKQIVLIEQMQVWNLYGVAVFAFLALLFEFIWLIIFTFDFNSKSSF